MRYKYMTLSNGKVLKQIRKCDIMKYKNNGCDIYWKMPNFIWYNVSNCTHTIRGLIDERMYLYPELSYEDACNKAIEILDNEILFYNQSNINGYYVQYFAHIGDAE